VLAVAALPWSGIAVHGAIVQWREAEPAQRRALRFLVLWSLFTLGFFSLSGSKLPSYILPILPAFALLAGRFATQLAPGTLLLHLLPVLLLAAVLLALTPQIGRRADEETPLAMMLAYRDFLAAAAGVWLLATIAAIALRRRTMPALLALATGSLIAFTLAMLGHETLSRSNSAWHIAQQIRPLLPPQVPFYAVRMYDQTLTFYLGRTVTLVDYADEMGFGLRQEPRLAIPTIEEFARRWGDDPDAFAITTAEGYRQLIEAGLPMQVVAQDTRRVVVRKSAAP
jgi:4-amino-4-deoxy-L-arabinose transferase-like glycosyltransferase